MTNFIKHKMRRKSAGAIMGWILLGIVAVTAFAILFGFLIMWLWNWLMPGLFGLGVITYWQAVGIFILAKILFGGFGGGGGGKKHGPGRKGQGPCGNSGRAEFSKWKHYDTFWKEEGEAAFNEYITRKKEKHDTQS